MKRIIFGFQFSHTKTVSGKFTSKGKDMDGNNIAIQAEFINVKNNGQFTNTNVT